MKIFRLMAMDGYLNTGKQETCYETVLFVKAGTVAAYGKNKRVVSAGGLLYSLTQQMNRK